MCSWSLVSKVGLWCVHAELNFRQICAPCTLFARYSSNGFPVSINTRTVLKWLAWRSFSSRNWVSMPVVPFAKSQIESRLQSLLLFKFKSKLLFLFFFLAFFGLLLGIRLLWSSPLLLILNYVMNLAPATTFLVYKRRFTGKVLDILFKLAHTLFFELFENIDQKINVFIPLQVFE